MNMKETTLTPVRHDARPVFEYWRELNQFSGSQELFWKKFTGKLFFSGINFNRLTTYTYFYFLFVQVLVASPRYIFTFHLV